MPISEGWEPFYFLSMRLKFSGCCPVIQLRYEQTSSPDPAWSVPLRARPGIQPVGKHHFPHQRSRPQGKNPSHSFRCLASGRQTTQDPILVLSSWRKPTLRGQHRLPPRVPFLHCIPQHCRNFPGEHLMDQSHTNHQNQRIRQIGKWI